MPTIEQARKWYPGEDPVHGFDHMLRVYRLAESIALAEGADLEIVRAAALLHDAQAVGAEAQSSGSERRGEHHKASAELAQQVLEAEGWQPGRIEAVQHCIQAHRFRDETTLPQTLEAKVLFDADKLDAIGAVGAARAIAYAARLGQPFYSPPSARFVESGLLEAGEPHSAYHEYLFKLSKIAGRLHTACARQMAEERQRRMVDYFSSLAQEMDAAAWPNKNEDCPAK